MKVFFCCSWDNDSSNFIKKKMNPLTKNSLGKWKTIESTSNIREAEWVVIVDDINPVFINYICNFNPAKIICIPREPGREFPSYLNTPIKYKLTYSNFFHCWTSIQCIVKNYDDLIQIPLKMEKPKLCSTVTSGLNHGCGIYQLRIEFIKKLSKCTQFMNKIDIFGYNWKREELSEMYKGTFGEFNAGTMNVVSDLIPNTTKWDGLETYKYSIAIENDYKDNYFSEKFTDCILARTVPIYYGCPNISKYFPKECYYWLDITKDDCMVRLEEILNTPITKKQYDAIEKARELILHKYNIWEVIHDIIDKDKD